MDGITGYGERGNDLFLGDPHRFGQHHTISGNRCPEKWVSPINAVAGMPRNLIVWFPMQADEKFGDH